MNCPLCSSESSKVMYAGLPMRMCTKSDCMCCFGGMAWVMEWIHFNGVFVYYTGSYWKALWHFLRGDHS